MGAIIIFPSYTLIIMKQSYETIKSEMWQFKENFLYPLSSTPHPFHDGEMEKTHI